jgi:2-methylaconitate cis-trans-isomerase PrpF
VPGTGRKIKIDFFSPEGSITGKLLPTGNVKDIIDREKKASLLFPLLTPGIASFT